LFSTTRVLGAIYRVATGEFQRCDIFSDGVARADPFTTRSHQFPRRTNPGLPRQLFRVPNEKDCSMSRSAASLSQERIYQVLVEAISDYAIFMLDINGFVSSWNAGAQRFKGYDASEILGEHFSRFYTEDDRQAKVPELALETARCRGRFEREGWRIRKDGSRFWAHVVIDAIKDDEGKLVGFAKITRDLTERKLAREQLGRTEKQFQILVQGVTDYAIFMLDPEGRVTTWNPGAQRIKGYSADEIVGRHFSRFYTEEDRRASVPELALETARCEGRSECEGWRVRKNGSRFWGHVVIDAIQDDEGKIVGFAKITRDDTERRATRVALEAFAHTVSHELRAPLRGMEGFARILLDDFAEALGQNGRGYAERIVAAAERMKCLIADLLMFSRLQRAEISLRPLDPTGIVRRQVEQALALDGGHRATITIAEPLPAVLAEPLVFAQILANLLSNAVKFHGSEKPVKVRVCGERGGDRVRIWVEDDGIGISPEHQAKIFNVFERLHGQETYSGTGIGLAIVKTGIERMGGTAGVVSEFGRGSRFWIELAAAEIAAPNGGSA